ncbi:MAG: DUF494 family protein [Bacteroidota bacterium]|nr:DUF494 family protein [Bacteroidota bacterium]
MQERIIEIIVHILNEIKTTNKKLQDVSVENLEKLGYTNSEMNAAFSWLFDKFYLSKYNPAKLDIETSGSRRILHEIEKMAISPEAFGYLIQLRELSIISDVDVELIIERIMLTTTHTIEIEEMKDIVFSVIFGSEDHIFGRFSTYDDENIN